MDERTEREMAMEIYYRCPSLATEALKALQSSEPARRQRWRWLVWQALHQPGAGWTEEEQRALLELAGTNERRKEVMAMTD